MNKKIILSALFLLTIPIFFVFGQNGIAQSGDDVVGILENILNWLWNIFLIVTIMFFLLAAFLYVTSSGNTDRIQQAKSMIVYGVIGIVVALLARTMTDIITSVMTTGS